MKYLFLNLIITLTLSAKTLVITDIDDTIKQTNVLDHGRAVASLVQDVKEFEYLKKILAELNAQDDTSYVYVSASLDCTVDQNSWLRKKNFPQGTLFQKSCSEAVNGKWVDTKSYKIANIKKYLLKNSKKFDEIFLIGDNGQKDAEVYVVIKNNFKDLNINIFIRDIRAQATALSTTLSPYGYQQVHYFLTEYDLLGLHQFDFLSSTLKNEIKVKFKSGALYPDYLKNNLAKRYQEEHSYPKQAAMKAAKADLLNYRLDINGLEVRNQQRKATLYRKYDYLNLSEHFYR